MEEKVEMIEIWQPVEQGGEAINMDGKNLKRIAVLVNGYPIFLETDYCVEKRSITKEEAKLLTNNFKSLWSHTN